MTAILGSLHNNIPWLVGDLMISNTEPPGKTTTLPVSGQNSHETPIWCNYRYFTGWKQKLNLIGPSMIVAWSGTGIEAKLAIGHLRDSYSSCDTTKLTNLKDLALSINNLEDIKDTGFIFLISCQEGWEFFTVDPSNKADLKPFQTPWGENAVAGGTGTDHLIDALDAEFSHGAHDNFNKALGSLLQTGARMWYQDIKGIGPQLAFGGAYELAIKQNNDLVKIDDILYITVVYDNEEKGIRPVPVFLKIDYVEDILIARVFDIRNPENPDLRIYIVPPIDKAPPLNEEELLKTLPDLNASHFATYLKVESSKPETEHSTALHTYRLAPKENEVDKRPIKFKYDGKSLPVEMHVNTNYLHSLLTEVMELKKMAGEPFP